MLFIWFADCALLDVNEIDPIGRHLSHSAKNRYGYSSHRYSSFKVTVFCHLPKPYLPPPPTPTPTQARLVFVFLFRKERSWFSGKFFCVKKVFGLGLFHIFEKSNSILPGSLWSIDSDFLLIDRSPYNEGIQADFELVCCRFFSLFFFSMEEVSPVEWFAEAL